MDRRELDFWDKDDFKEIVGGWPDSLRRKFSQALAQVQRGEKPSPKVARHLKGLGIHLTELKHRCGARVVFTLEYVSQTDHVHVLDAFMKDSADGDQMRKSDKERIQGRVAQLRLRVARSTGKQH